MELRPAINLLGTSLPPCCRGEFEDFPFEVRCLGAEMCYRRPPMWPVCNAWNGSTDLDVCILRRIETTCMLIWLLSDYVGCPPRFLNNDLRWHSYFSSGECKTICQAVILLNPQCSVLVSAPCRVYKGWVEELYRGVTGQALIFSRVGPVHRFDRSPWNPNDMICWLHIFSQ